MNLHLPFAHIVEIIHYDKRLTVRSIDNVGNNIINASLTSLMQAWC